MKKIPSWTVFVGAAIALIEAAIITYIVYVPLDAIAHNDYAQGAYGKAFVGYFFFTFFLMSALSLDRNLEKLKKNAGTNCTADIDSKKLHWCFYGNDFSMKLTLFVLRRKWLFYAMLIIPVLYLALHMLCRILFWIAELLEGPIDWVKWHVFRKY